MSEYDDDAERLGDTCDGCGLPFVQCDCEEPPEGVFCDKCGAPVASDGDRLCPMCQEAGGIFDDD